MRGQVEGKYVSHNGDKYAVKERRWISRLLGGKGEEGKKGNKTVIAAPLLTQSNRDGHTRSYRSAMMTSINQPPASPPHTQTRACTHTRTHAQPPTAPSVIPLSMWRSHFSLATLDLFISYFIFFGGRHGWGEAAKSSSSSTYRTMGVNVFPFVILRTGLPHTRHVQVGSWSLRWVCMLAISGGNRKENKWKHKTSRWCFNSSHPPSHRSVRPIALLRHRCVERAAALVCWHPSVLVPFAAGSTPHFPGDTPHSHYSSPACDSTC